jgi:hypothetical protein
MRRSSNTLRDPQPSVFASLLGPVLFVAVAGIVGWILLVTIKWLVVVLLIAIGISLVVVPIAAGRRIMGTATGSNRRHRIGQLATAVLLGFALIVLAVVVAHHGWLLIVVPVAIVLVGRLMARFTEWRVNRRNASFH